MAPNKLKLTVALLSSSLFAFFPLLSHAIVDLDAAANNQDSTNPTYPPGTGYNFVAPNVIFSIDDGVDPGIDPVTGYSIANNLNNPGSPHANTVIQFVGDSTIAGSIGTADNPISLMNINSGFGANKTVLFQDPLSGVGIYADKIQLVDNGSLSPLDSSTLHFNSNVQDNVFAPITTMTDGMGNLRISAPTIFNNTIGSPSQKLNLITLDSADASAEFKNDVYANQILFDLVNVTISVNNATLFAPVVTSNNQEGLVTFFGTTQIVRPMAFTRPEQLWGIDVAGFETVLSVENNMNAQRIDLRLGSTTRFVGLTEHNTDNFNVIEATLALAHGAIAKFTGGISTNNLNMDATSFFEVDMANELTPVGFFEFAGTATINPAVQVRVRNPSYSPGQTTSFIILEDATGAALPVSLPVIENSLLSNITVTSSGNTLLLNVTSTPSSDFANYSNTTGIAHALDEIAVQILSTPSSNALKDVLEQMGQFTDAMALNQALASIAPIVDSALVYEAFFNQQTIFGDIGERMDTVRFWQKHMPNGMSNGDDCYQDSAWIKLIGHHAEQDERDNIAGYNNNMQGIVAGWDVTRNNALTVGGSLAWTYSRVDHKVWDGSKTDTHSFQGSAYFAYNCPSPLFFDTIIGLAYNNYNQYREVQFGTLHLSPSADFDGWQWGIKSAVGYVMDSQFYNSHVVPNISLYYSHLIISAYDEEGAGTASQSYERSNYDALILSAGVKFLQDWVDKAVLIQPELHFNVYYDFVGDRMETDTQFFAGVGPTFRTLGFEPSQLGANVGAAASLFTHRGVTWTAEYDFNVKADYFSHTGFLRARYVWG